MPLEDNLKDIIKKLNHFLEENEDVDNQDWFLFLQKGTNYIERCLQLLEQIEVKEVEDGKQ